MKSFLLLLLGFISVAHGQDTATPDANSIINKVIAQYKSMPTYSSNGTVVSDVQMNGTTIHQTTTFSIKLKKPNLYLITWSQAGAMPQLPTQSGAVWSDGTQPYLYMGQMNAYSKIGGDDSAIGAATGISGGAAFTISSLFLPSMAGKGIILSQLKNPMIEMTEPIAGEDSYVLSGSTATSKKESYWVSKSRNLILKFERSLSAPAGGAAVPDISDADLEKSLRSMGQPVTEESKKRMRDMMLHAKDTLKNSDLSGESTETQTDVSSPDMTADDFNFTPPKGATLKESLFGAQTGFTKPVQIPTSNGSSSYEEVHAPVVKVFSTTDGDNKFIAYAVQWKGADVIVSDPLARSDYKVGDTIKFLAQKIDGSKSGSSKFTSLSFTLL
jgi:outer membrane lipoprotein-sorting protein